LEAGATPLLDPTPTASFFTGVGGSHPRGKGGTRSRSCPYCKGGHSAIKCVTVKDSTSKKAIITKAGLCYNCLSSSHRSADCPSKFRCRHCGGKHHTTICEKSDKQQNIPSAPSPGNKESPSPGNTSESVHATFTPTQMGYEYPILLKTAVSQVKVGNLSRDANILLDEGAQRSFITKDLADDLGAKPVSTQNISMSSFGSTEHSLRRLEVTTVDVITEQGDKIPLRVLVVPHIATPLKRQHNADINNMPHLRGLRLAHPVSSGNFSINLLIGADHYWDIVQDTIIRGDRGPTAMQSKLGYLLSGPIGSRGKQDSATTILHIAAHKEEEFDVKKFWSIESLGKSSNDDLPDKNFLAS